MVGAHAPYMVATYVRPPPMMVKGEGCYLWDVENRRYLDFTAGIAVNALGHCDPEMSKLIGQQVPDPLQGHCQFPAHIVIRQEPLSTPPTSTTTLGPANSQNYWSTRLVLPAACTKRPKSSSATPAAKPTRPPSNSLERWEKHVNPRANSTISSPSTTPSTAAQWEAFPQPRTQNTKNHSAP